MASGLPEPATANVPKKSLFEMDWIKTFKGKTRVSKESPGMSQSASLPSDTAEPNSPPCSSQEPSVSISELEVIEQLWIYKRYRQPHVVPGVEITDLPNFDDVTDYGVSEQIQEQLWRMEVSRLVAAVNSAEPAEFRGSKSWQIDSLGSYQTLAKLVNRAWWAISIILHDGHNLFAEHKADFFEPETRRKMRMVLDFICNNDDDGNETDDDGGDLSPAMTEDLFNFIDYCTAVLARNLCLTMDGESFHISLVAHIARIATKLKVVSAKPREFSQISIDNSVPEETISASAQEGSLGRPVGGPAMSGSWMPQESGEASGSGKPLDSPPDQPRGLMNLEMLRSTQKSKKDALKILYLTHCKKLWKFPINLLRIIFLSLKGASMLKSVALTSYEFCAIIYETGFERFRTLVFQDHENDITGTSDASWINLTWGTFYTLNQVVTGIEARPDRATVGAEGSVGTFVSWDYAPSHHSAETAPQRRSMHLRSMDEIITVIVPLLMASPVFIYDMSNFVHVLAFADDDAERQANPVKPRSYEPFTAFFCLTTREHHMSLRQRGQDGGMSLSNALMGRTNPLSGKTLTKIGHVTSFAIGKDGSLKSYETDRETLDEARKHQRELDDANYQMNTWVFEEKGVMVQCRLYVCSLVVFCTALVVGGLSIGITVEERIEGVDPFNVTTYAWVLAAFMLIVAKSVRVQTWSWNDFLHGRVLCKSVSELSSVTGIDAQVILAKLLQDESISFLQTRGPYNTVFNRTSEDGFSIDSPLSTWTMLQSGLIMIEVETWRGRGLVCLDLRRGTKYSIISYLGEYEGATESENIYCDQLIDDKDPGFNGDAQRVRLKKGKWQWIRGVGFHRDKNAKFT